MGLEKIGIIRKNKGITIEELSTKSGVPVSTIKKISAGITTNPNLDTVKALTRALGCTLDDLDDDIKSPPAEAEGPYLTDKAYEVARAYQDADQHTKDIVCLTLRLEPDKSSSASSDAAV